MAAPGHPNSNNPVVPDGDGGFETTPGDDGMVPCPQCGGSGQVPGGKTEADLDRAAASIGGRVRMTRMETP